MATLPSFSDLSQHFPDPWSTLVLRFGELVYQDYFDNFVIAGEKPGDEKVECHAWWIFGLVPGYEGVVECRFMDGSTEEDRRVWNARFASLLPLLATDGEFESHSQQDIVTMTHMTHGCMSASKMHLLGMIGIYTTVKSNRELAVLWRHRGVTRPLLEFLIKNAMIEKIKAM